MSRSGPGGRARLALDLISRGRKVAIFVRDGEELAELRALLALLDPAGGEKTEVLPLWERRVAHFSPYSMRAGHFSGQSERAAALYALSQGECACTLLSPDALLLRAPPADLFTRHSLCLRKGQEMPLELIPDQLTEWGYVRSPMVGSQGEFSIRGDILDIFCPGYPRPARLEFFGDSLEDLRIFDPASQRSSGGLEKLTILPVRGLAMSADLRRQALERWEKMLDAGRLDSDDVYLLRKDLEAGGRRLLPGMYYEKCSRIEDWLPKDPVLLLPGRVALEDSLRAASGTWASWLEGQAKDGDAPRQPEALVMRPESEVLAWLGRQDRLYFEDLYVGVEAAGEALPERAIHSFKEFFLPLAASLGSVPSGGKGKVGSPYSPGEVLKGPPPSAAGLEVLERPWHFLVQAMREWSEEKNGQVLLSFSGERTRAKFLDLAGQEGIVPRESYIAGRPGLYARISSFRRGLLMGLPEGPADRSPVRREEPSPFRLRPGEILILGEDVLQPQGNRAERRGSAPFKGLDRYDELAEGDLLVHRDYGICAFGGLKRLQLGEAANDFLLLRYAGDDKLYLPVDRLGLVQLFKTPDGFSPVLDRLGGGQWSAGKEKARKAIEEIARDLVEMYAYRKVAKGYGYSNPGELYREFEAGFGFEETPDQTRAIEEVLEDMSRPEPMDRLICGDVGFGKTEVALRAAFRAALDGRQSVLLCPTTVLAEQHYQTFRARLAGFPLNVGLLSRFVSRTGQAEVLKELAAGRIDILIGTHRVLSKDVRLPNLGLLILDEEQRFGVRHKENLKQLKKNVDVLTLTATPIPRTLQLSLSGVRELSVIETPPPERKSVTTAMIERDDAALRAVLERELARQGQVFWVYNRVHGLERAADYVKKLAPEARVGLAHGQMEEKALEESMRRFWHGELDVLVCTAIIESGLDFPMANTLVVDQAQMFGLGQLYQLRGRVGRSDRQAYAVFVCPDMDRLQDKARQRLRVILEMDYLGAGMQVAMEDLRLRGAGNILGESQSGHMQRLGLDLFLEMLEEEVSRLRGRPLRERVEMEMRLGVSAHIPESYIEDGRERLRYYKTLSAADSIEEQREVEFELRDRFGPVPEELESFFSVLNLKRRLAAWGAESAEIQADRLRLQMGRGGERLDPVAVISWVQGSNGRVRLNPPAGLEIRLEGESLPQKLARAVAELAPALDPSGPG
ncbi:MAG: transcription-repair coupling factor [Desulfovibrionaceae bacterium]|nr:transcription-repair coupling factor [Desulfovibrionaceae bacterium]